VALGGIGAAEDPRETGWWALPPDRHREVSSAMFSLIPMLQKAKINCGTIT